MRFFLIALLLSGSALADVRYTLTDCPMLDINNEPVAGITNSERFDTASNKLKDNDSVYDGKYFCAIVATYTKTGNPKPAPEPNEPPIVVPPEPNEPPIQANCELIETHEVHPECAVSYQPQLLPRDQWTRPEFAQPIHDDTAAKVVLKSRETLNTALDRLYALDTSGGIIEVPWDVDTVQCDLFRMNKQPIDALSVIGQRGPNGELPRFYCRRYKIDTHPDGTVTDNGGVFFFQGRRSDASDVELPTRAYVEGIHVDGYTNWFTASATGSLSIVNVYAHHASSNGVVSSQIKSQNKYTPSGNDTQIGGSELSHGGQGNTEHCIYYHGSSLPGVQQKLSMTGNLIHSCNWSSAVKSIANVNVLDGNTILKTRPADPSYTQRHSSMLVDIPSCSQTLVQNNTLIQNRPHATTPGSAALSSRNRKSFFGCNQPDIGWDDMVNRELIPRPEAVFWSADYWKTVNNQRTLPFTVKNNIFISEGHKADKNIAIEASGSFPNWTYTLGGWACYMAIPPGWSERTILNASGNTYHGYAEAYSVNYPGSQIQVGDTDRCGNVWQGPDVRNYDLIHIGEGEVYL